MNLNGRTINPGELTTQVTLKKRAVTTGTGGFLTGTPGDTIAAVWARWENVHGSEVWAAEAQQAEKPATVLIRYRSDVDETCYVVKGAVNYEIVSMDNIQERNEFLELKVRFVRAG